MGKTILVIVAVILALACGALGLQVLKSTADTQSVDKKLTDMEARLKKEIGVSKDEPRQPETVPAVLEEVLSQLSGLKNRALALEKRLDNLEKKTASSADLHGAEPESGYTLPDFGKMTPQEREEWSKVIREEIANLRQKQAMAFKEGILKNIRSNMDTAAEKLNLTPVQRSELDTLLSEQVERGFQFFMRLFQEGNFERIRIEIQSLVNETDEKVKEILYPDQIEKLKELDPEGFGRREQHRLESKKE